VAVTSTGSNVNGYLTVTGNVTSGNANLGNAATANYFIGNFYGTANIATSAINASALLQNTSTAITVYPTFTTSSANGNSSAVFNSSISANLGNASITATTFVGALTGNATTATTLATSRTLWGQGFTGAANVTGSLTSVGDITGTAGVTLTATAATLALAATGANSITASTNGTVKFTIDSTGNITPGTTNTQTLGAVGDVWSNVHATTFTGALTGNADTATKWATPRLLAGNSVDGSANVAFSNKFVVQGTTDAGLSGAQFLGALGTGIVKNTTTTGVLSIAVAGDFPTLNQNTTGSAATLTTSRNINGVAFNGSADITVTAAAGTLTGTTLNATVVNSSLTRVGTVTSGTWSGLFGAVSGANLTNITAANIVGTLPNSVLGNTTIYVGTTAVTLNRASSNLGLTGITSVAMPGATSGTITLTPAATAGTTAITIPATAGTLVTTGDIGTVTNAMLAGSIANAKLANSAITIGTTAISLGSANTTLAGLTSVSSTAFTGALTGNATTATTLATSRNINGVAFNGSANITVTAAAGTLTGATLASGVTASSLTSVGTLSSLTVSGTTSLTGATTFVGSAATTPAAVAFSATAMTIPCASSNVFTTTFTANVTVAPAFSNLKDGQTINWFITQDATGSRTMTWPSSFKWPGGSAGVLSTAANSVDLLVATYRSATGFWYATLSKGFA
jgi:hypothetical protein